MRKEEEEEEEEEQITGTSKQARVIGELCQNVGGGGMLN